MVRSKEEEAEAQLHGRGPCRVPLKGWALLGPGLPALCSRDRFPDLPIEFAHLECVWDTRL